MKVIDRQLPELADSPGLNPHFMSLNGILISVVIPFVTISAYHSFTKRVPERQSIRTTLAASRQSILPYESLSVLLLLHNETAEEKRVVASWCSFLHIGETTPAGTKWRGYRADNEPVTKPCIPTAKQFAPGETKKMLAHIDDESPSGEHIFARPGKYLLQGGTMDNGTFVSDEIEINVRAPEGIDARAYELLRTSYLHHFFGEYTIQKYGYDQKTVQDLEKFITDFDGSEYSYLARMGLAFMWLRGVEGKQDQSSAVELLSQIADRASDSLSSAAEYRLGVILYNPQDKMALAQANNRFQRALAGTPTPYFRYLAEEALRPR